MTQYTVVPIKTDEKLFTQYNYPYSAAHKHENDMFVINVAGLQENIYNNQIVITFEYTHSLKDLIKKTYRKLIKNIPHF